MLSQNFSHETIALSDYGKNFQLKMIANLLTNRQTLEELYDILDETLFESASMSWIVSKLKVHFSEYKELPEKSTFKVYITKDSSINDVNKLNIAKTLRDIYIQAKSTDLAFVQKEAVDFFRYKNFEKTLLGAFDFLETKEYDKIFSSVNDAMVAGTKRDLGLNYNDQIDERYKINARDPVPTYWAPVDDMIDGGLSSGELGAILALSSVGKSWVLQYLSTNAIMHGYNVVYYTLEDEEAFVGQRKDSILTNISTHELKHHTDAIRNTIDEKIKGKEYIKFFPSEITKMSALDAHLSKLRMSGFEPDLVIIDYGDLLSPMKAFHQDWLNQRQIFAEMKSFAQVHKLPVWTASQAGASAKDDFVIDTTKMGRAYQKIAPLSVCLSFQRYLEDKLAGTGRLFLAKNKLGKDGITFPCKVDLQRGVFVPMSPDTKEGQAANNKMLNGEQHMKKRVKSKWDEYKDRITQNIERTTNE